jgi:predicted Zn-dependent peptidase
VIDRKEAPQTTVLLGLPTLIPKDKDAVALQVTNSLLGGSFGSRITSNIREDKGYTYSPFSTIQNRKGVSVWYEQADVTSKDTGNSLQEIAKEIRKLQNEVPSRDELEGIQRYMAGTFVLQNSNSTGIVNQLNFLDLHGLDDSYLTDRVKNIYAVTPEKVSQMTKDYFKYEDMTLVLVGDKKLLENQIKQHEAAKKMK